jgi:hypothetical protein
MAIQLRASNTPMPTSQRAVAVCGIDAAANAIAAHIGNASAAVLMTGIAKARS